MIAVAIRPIPEVGWRIGSVWSWMSRWRSGVCWCCFVSREVGEIFLRSFQKEKVAGIAKKVQSEVKKMSRARLPAALVENERQQFCVICITNTSVVRTKASVRGLPWREEGEVLCWRRLTNLTRWAGFQIRRKPSSIFLNIFSNRSAPSAQQKKLGVAQVAMRRPFVND